MPQDKAPADHPEHPSNLGHPLPGDPALTHDHAAARDFLDRERLRVLLEKYATPAELDAGHVPDRIELETREQLVLDAYDAASDDDPAAHAVLVDLTGTTYRWKMHDDQPDHWVAEEVDDETPAFEDLMGPSDEEQAAAFAAKVNSEAPPVVPSASELDAALAALDAARGGRG